MRRTLPQRLRIAAWMATVVLVALPASGAGTASKPQLPINGKLVQTSSGPTLRVNGKDFRLSAARPWYLHTLEDNRLANREIRVEGEWAPDGSLKVTHFYTVKNGKLYRVRYYCEVCNIAALEPGKCVCCQHPTELQEIPVEHSGTTGQPHSAH